MKGNKPLLFINSAQTEEFKDQSQYVFDSRYNKPQKIQEKTNLTPVKKEAKEEPVKEKKSLVDVEDPREIIKQKQETNEEFIDKKLLNKIDLLDKRAKLERYVLVSIETESNEYEGYFIQKKDGSVELKQDDEKITININSIRDILIIKV